MDGPAAHLRIVDYGSHAGTCTMILIRIMVLASYYLYDVLKTPPWGPPGVQTSDFRPKLTILDAQPLIKNDQFSSILTILIAVPGPP